MIRSDALCDREAEPLLEDRTEQLHLHVPEAGQLGNALPQLVGVARFGPEPLGPAAVTLGDEGAQVYDTLRSSSNSIQADNLAKDEERANRATTVLYIPTSLLVLVLFAIAAYPFLIRLATS